jgi:hypothetical protein
MFIRRKDMKEIRWLREIIPLKLNNEPLRFRKSNWNNIPKQEYRSFIVRISIREKRSWPGPVRSYWRKRRNEAIHLFKTKWGAVPEAMQLHHVPPNRILFKSKGWRQW